MNTGIICEFNPFHKGHKHLIDSVKDDFDAVICVMSGNLVQRGEFAVADKFERTRTALENGADLVIELPCVYSLMSAEGFACNAVKILEATGVVDRLAFGAECADVKALSEAAEKIQGSADEIALEMKKGVSYPTARKNIIGDDILDSPNNILAIEYIKSTSLPCVAVKRIGKGHDTDDVNYSASAIREKMNIDEIHSLKSCERAVLAKLRTMSRDDFLKIEDVNEGLENRIVQAVMAATSLEDLYDKIKTKRYTHSRIRRIVLRSYLGITRDYSFEPPYIRILGFNSKGREILKDIKKKSKLPVITRYADVKQLDDNATALFELESRCTDLYNLGCAIPKPCGLEKTSQIIIIK